MIFPFFPHFKSYKCSKLQASDFPDFTETELKDLCSVPCHIELFHSNVCYGIEKSWPKRIYNRREFKDLTPWQKRRLHQKMRRNAVYLYNRYVDENRLKERRKNRTNRALAPYYEERYLRNCFNRIKALGDGEYDGAINLSDSETSLITVINTSDYENVEFSLRSRQKRPRKSKPGPQRLKSQSSIHSDSGPETQNESRIVYEHSSSSAGDDCDEDDYLSANEEEPSQGRRSNRSAATSVASPNATISVNTSPFVTPSKEMDDVAPISTPTIKQLRQLRSYLFHVDTANNVSSDRNVGMVIEAETESIVEFVLPKPVRGRKKTDRDAGIEARNPIVRNDSSSDDSSSIDGADVPLIIDERFNDIIFESSVSSSIQTNNDDMESLRSVSSPRLDSRNFMKINSNDVQRLRNMDIIGNLNTSSSSSRSRYSLRNQKANVSNSGNSRYSLRHPAKEHKKSLNFLA